MLFSELNRLNLNVLIKDSDQEALPNLDKIHIQNAYDWTIFCSESKYIEEKPEISSFETDDISNTLIPSAYLIKHEDNINKIYINDLNITTDPSVDIETCDNWMEWLNIVKNPELYRIYNKINGKFLKDQIIKENIYKVIIDDLNGKLNIEFINIKNKADDQIDSVFDKFIINDNKNENRYTVQIVNGKLYSNVELLNSETEICSTYSSYNGWNLKPIIGNNLEDNYLTYALSDIKNSIVLKESDDSDIVKIYAGSLDYCGILDFSKFNNSKNLFHGFDNLNNNCHNRDFNRRIVWNNTYYGWWWAISNGAFQWTSNPKDIINCRFHYDPFRHNCDHHHFDKNDNNIRDVIDKDFVPALTFIFDTRHELKGIVSLPCYDDNQRQMEIKFIENFLNFAKYFGPLNFKNFSKALKSFMESPCGLYWPNICITDNPVDDFDINDKKDEAVIVSTCNHDELPFNVKHQFIPIIDDNVDLLTKFLNKSIWTSFTIEDSMKMDADHEIKTRQPISIYINRHLKHCKNNKTTLYVMSIENLFKHYREIEKDYDVNYDILTILPYDIIEKFGLNIVYAISKNRIVKIEQ